MHGLQEDEKNNINKPCAIRCLNDEKVAQN
jgi:hypothetical protein